METTLKEIGISIAKAVVSLVDKVINAKITTKRIYIAFLIIFFGFIAILIIGIIFWGGPPPGSYEDWLNEEPTAEDWQNDEFIPWLESPEGKDWLKKNE